MNLMLGHLCRLSIRVHIANDHAPKLSEPSICGEIGRPRYSMAVRRAFFVALAINLGSDS